MNKSKKLNAWSALLVAAIAAGCASIPGGSEPASVAVEASLGQATWDVEIPAILERHKVPAIAFAVIDDGRIVAARTYGTARPGVAATQQTRFNIASLTKPLAAEVLLRLAEKRQIDLDEPMARYWVDPDIAADPRTQLMTARMALVHRTGLPNWRNQTGNQLQFVQDPGVGFRYGGEQFTYAARYAQARLNVPFETLAQRELFGPVGMTATRMTVWTGMGDQIAFPHNANGQEDWPIGAFVFSAACCTYSTPSDYARFVISVMDGTGISASTRRARFDYGENQRQDICGPGGMPQEICPADLGVKLGWFVFRYPGKTLVNHTGSNPGDKSLAYFDPVTRDGFVAMTNGANGNRAIRDLVAMLEPDTPIMPYLSALAQ
jgi:CubicO group peptidase (beta-lactamase class C family)